MNQWPNVFSPSRSGAVEVIGAGIEYADGAEDQLLSVMTAAADRSSGSDELTRAICDWPTQYHLSPQRANLLLPLALGPGMRVLDVGCGTGALTRHIAESGADVIGLEGSLDRARVAAARVAGMPGARIVAGSLEDYLEHPPAGAPTTFDVVVACGVLEYSGAHMGGDGSAPTMLAQLRSLVGETGRLALAIENRWGLKYLLSYPEDHLGRPWIGVEGYWADRSGITTWSRRELAELLTQAGLAEQTWFAAYPDYKLPSALVREEMFTTQESVDLVKLFVRSPTSADAGGPVLVADAVSSFHSALDAGLGLDLANSFLVVCGPSSTGPDIVAPPSIHLGVQRRARAWRQSRFVVRSDEQWVLGTHGSSEPVEHWPLRAVRRESIVHPGRNAEDLIAEALISDGLSSPQLREILQRWWREANTVLNGTEESGGPFDVLPRNFVVTDSDAWVFVDQELEWQSPFPPEVAGGRALLWTVAGLVNRVPLIPGCPPSTTVAALALSLSHAAGIDVRRCEPGDLLDFESSLQALISGDATPGGTEALRARLEGMMDTPLNTLQSGLPFVRLTEQADRLASALTDARAESSRLAAELEAARVDLARLATELQATREVVATMSHSRRWRLAEALRHPRIWASDGDPRT